MKFLIQPIDFWQDLSKLADDSVLKRLGCSDGTGCCNGERQCTAGGGGGDEPEDEC